jgi:hypothetical protein
MAVTVDILFQALATVNTQWLVVALGCLMGAMLFWHQPQ